ncbi:MAG: hypothetical protein II712_05255, partial [Erysipelotrichaceae bacterium]|nr:hypothetical protein [Erysipelotrichaceae bacterium]
IGGVLEDIQSIQRDELNPNDCAKDPHDITHTVDGVRYFCINRSLQAQKPEKKREPDEFDDVPDEYENYMTGGEIPEQYMTF